MSSINPAKIKRLIPLHDHILVSDMTFKERISHGGIVLPSNNGKTEGIHPRAGRVYAVGPEQKDVTVGQWVTVAHGRWTRGLDIEEIDSGEKLTVRRIDPKDILFVSDEKPSDDTIGQSI